MDGTPVEIQHDLNLLYQKLRKARNLLMMVMPHFIPLLEVAESAGPIRIVKDENATACTYPNAQIEFGEAFLSKLSVLETAFIIAHE